MLWKLLKANHVDPAKLFSQYGLKYRDLLDPEIRVSLKLIPQLWDDAYELIDSHSFGLDAYKYWHPSYMGALGYAWLSSETLREAFKRMQRFISIISDSGEIIIEENASHFKVSFNYQQLGYNPARSDNAMSIVLHMCRINYQDSLHPSLVTFSHPEPDDIGDYYAYFQSKLSFSEVYDSLTFPLEVIDSRLPGANKQLAQLNDQVMRQYLKSLESKVKKSPANKKLLNDALIDKINTIIVKKMPSGLVTGQIVAKDIGMSYRSLQRKLAESNTTFKDLFEQSRHELAEEYILDDHLSMTEITFMLGFSELSSFSRAYRRWTGVSPRSAEIHY
ncbi:AraC family transcriptional regulator [sulfur-oxidizing endosymbiont of Gigantopelta aegis]|uniref:AraC family transcriptional regulator n=1 Tax=sulfur-oxidizing endosymbiont of Gigantopelta aegis TaxID=2794934 RepID=UPI001BE4084B|nr:AraC family transcriptional regulator [sulfur-oxidizing endosymbiont of Gigantopelta aegis]